MAQGFIGYFASVVKSPNKNEEGIKGQIRKETKNSFMIGEKTILKKNRIFIINNKITRGECIIGKYQERIK